MSIIPINQMTEEDIKSEYISPAIKKKWDGYIKMEMAITDGRINLKGNVASRGSRKKPDYVLYLNPDKPIAVVEAKDNNHSISYGMQQALDYAQMLDVPFAYSSNGDGFVEHDFFTGMERKLSLDDFPSMDELYARYKKGAGLTDKEEKIIRQSYYSGQGTNRPRYYQCEIGRAHV